MTTDICRPIVGIENRSAQEVFDIMCDRIRHRTAHSGEGRSNGAGEDDLRLARGTVEAYLVERLRGEGYGPARRIIDARKYDPTSDDYWVNAEAKNNHRVTPLAALSAPQGEMERLREALDKRTFMTCVSGDGQTPYLKVHFNNLADAHAAHDELLGRKS